MHPILFEIPGLGFPIRSFGLMVVLGFLLGSYLFARLGERYSGNPEAEALGYANVPLWILGGILLGARGMYVLVEIFQQSPTGKEYLADPLKVFYYWEGGLVMYGGTFGGIAVGIWAANKYRLHVAHAFDLGLTAGFFGLSIGRIGCLLVGDDYGKKATGWAADLPFPVTIRVPELVKNPNYPKFESKEFVMPEGCLFGEENAGELLWATQPWMTINAILMGLIGLWLLKRRRYAGQVSVVLLLIYSIARFVIESFRGDKIRGLWFNDTLSTSQLVSVGLGLISLVLIIKWRGRRDENGGFAPGVEA